MDLERYGVVRGKNPREIVLLRALPCAWGKCAFCDYTADNGTDKEEIVSLNRRVLSHVTGETGTLDVIDSASCFDLPGATWEDIRTIVRRRGIRHMFTECHYRYRDRLEQWRRSFGIDITFRCGIETFDDRFRNEVLHKGVYFDSPAEAARYFQSVCLLVGVRGQTREMVARDIAIMKRYFERGCVNIYAKNSTAMEPDGELIQWFGEHYRFLESDPMVEVLWHTTDLGVG